MRIAGSTIAMTSTHFKEDTYTKVEELKVWMDPPDQASTGDTVQLSEQAKSIIDQRDGKTAALDPKEVIKNNSKLLIIQRLIEALTGTKITISSKHDPSGGPQVPVIDTLSNGAAAGESNRVGWGVQYEYHETYSETEQTTFAAGGIVKTADGQEIKFNLSLTMSREYVQSTDISVRAGDALLDPLVINFSGHAAELTDQKFAFDLDSDGVAEQMPFVAGGSGILVFDRNGDQKANNGTELFGPTTGDGFQELSALDQTKDGWIDENDGIYQQLYLWTKDGNGDDQLQGLQQSGVGAIAVPAVETSFDLKNQENQLVGRVNRTGIYLSENGQAGTVQQIDVAV